MHLPAAGLPLHTKPVLEQVRRIRPPTHPLRLRAGVLGSQMSKAFAFANR